MSTEENIRASVALKASVDYWSHRSPSEKVPTHGDIIETATVFYEWLGQFGEREGSGELPGPGRPMSTASTQAPSPQPNGDVSWTCPDCGSPMKRRSARDGSGDFFGCSQYPQCRGVRRLDGGTGTKKAPAKN